ncbi:MAG: permease [Spirochaetia bacterium]
MNDMTKMNDMKKKKRKGLLRDLLFLAAGAAAAAVLLTAVPGNSERFFAEGKRVILELAGILPAVMVLMGLFNVFVSKERVVQFLGSAAGFKSLLLGLALGTLPTGPLYIAFPIAASLRKKGARTASVLLFLFSWSCIKLPQELAELRFLGYEFMIVRLGLTIALTIPMAVLLERIIERGNQRGKNSR